MTDQDDIYYDALKARDARFDGRFFTGVLTTGIFCRPICPAKTPLRKNVQFFKNAASAFEAGLRPCLRCRPETAPDSPAWAGTKTSVKKALSLIHKGVMDQGGVEALAQRLGIGDRHLRRLFMAEIGTTPKAVADARRLLEAKHLVTDSTLSLTDVAFTAGYKSIRRFNEAYKASYGVNPSQTRRLNKDLRPEGEREVLRFPYRSGFHYEGWLRFLKARTLKDIDDVKEKAYFRKTSFGDVKINHDDKGKTLLITLPQIPIEELRPFVQTLRRMTDLGSNPDMILDHLKGDKSLRPLIKKFPGLRLPVCFDPFEAALRAITGQQVTVSYGKTLMARLIERAGKNALPTPPDIIEMDMEGIGMPQSRVGTLKNIAGAWRDNSLDENADYTQNLKALLQIKGIGPWSANYILLRGFGEPDAFPSGDAGLLAAWEKLSGKRLTAKELDTIAENWRPWRGYAAMALWWSLMEK